MTVNGAVGCEVTARLTEQYHNGQQRLPIGPPTPPNTATNGAPNTHPNPRPTQPLHLVADSIHPQTNP